MADINIDVSAKALERAGKQCETSSANKGGAIGDNALAGDGGAVGSGAKALVGGGQSGGYGGAVGHDAVSYSGGAIGSGAECINGFAGGNNAKATKDWNVQLGFGENNVEHSLQFENQQIVSMQNDNTYDLSEDLTRNVYSGVDLKPYNDEYGSYKQAFTKNAPMWARKISKGDLYINRLSGHLFQVINILTQNFDSDTGGGVLELSYAKIRNEEQNIQLRSPNSTLYKIVVDDNGNLSTEAVV